MPHSLYVRSSVERLRRSGVFDAPHLAVATKKWVRLLLLGDKVEPLNESLEDVVRAGKASKGDEEKRDELFIWE